MRAIHMVPGWPFWLAIALAALALVGSVQLTWSVSAFTVLVYYAITNWCALRQPADQRRFPRIVAVTGLLACLALAVGIVVGVLR